MWNNFEIWYKDIKNTRNPGYNVINTEAEEESHELSANIWTVWDKIPADHAGKGTYIRNNETIYAAWQLWTFHNPQCLFWHRYIPSYQAFSGKACIQGKIACAQL